MKSDVSGAKTFNISVNENRFNSEGPSMQEYASSSNLYEAKKYKKY